MKAVLLALLLLFPVSETPQEQAALLKTFREEFVLLTPGVGRFPKHPTLKQPFHVAKYEVPQNLWQSVMGSNPSRWKGQRNSAERLSFDQAQRFCKKATSLLRSAKLIEATQVVRLPFEDEWEYAARGGTKTDYSFGDVGKIDEYAWSTQNAAGNDPEVGVLKPNPWGLFDVHGYLWEWCQVRVETSSNVQAGETNKVPKKPVTVLRGGSWKDRADRLKSSFRLPAPAETKDDAVGLRCVLVTIKKADSSSNN